jgi:hypothetical protein
MADRTLNLQLQEMANHRQTQQNAPRTPQERWEGEYAIPFARQYYPEIDATTGRMKPNHRFEMEITLAFKVNDTIVSLPLSRPSQSPHSAISFTTDCAYVGLL